MNIDKEAIAKLIGKRCRCGCGQIATHIMTGTEFGKPFPPEACCKTVGNYCGEHAAESGDEHELIPIPQLTT